MWRVFRRSLKNLCIADVERLGIIQKAGDKQINFFLLLDLMLSAGSIRFPETYTSGSQPLMKLWFRTGCASRCSTRSADFLNHREFTLDPTKGQSLESSSHDVAVEKWTPQGSTTCGPGLVTLWFRSFFQSTLFDLNVLQDPSRPLLRLSSLRSPSSQTHWFDSFLSSTTDVWWVLPHGLDSVTELECLPGF